MKLPILAGDQGVAIAQRMTRELQQLPLLVEARTRDLERILESSAVQCRQVVSLGTGLDVKPLRYASEDQRWFLCDLKGMLAERAERLRACGFKDSHCIHVNVDLRLPNWTSQILASGFSADEKTLVILEGLSMYLTPSELQSLFERAAILCKGDARIWIDHPATSVFSSKIPEVMDFLAAMSRLGEPFITGMDSPVDLIGSKWEVVSTVSAADVLKENEPVLRQYLFSTLARRG